MFVYAGIDEAGFGPLLGPLCIGATVFTLREHDPAAGPPDLWRRLSSAVCRSASDRRRRVAIEDSKKLKGANGTAQPLRHLERGVLSMLALRGVDAIDDDAALFAVLGAEVPASALVPWYASTTQLPVAHDRGSIGIAAQAMRRAADGEGIGCASIECRAIDAGEFNRAFDRMRNKSEVSFATIIQLVEAIRRQYADDHPRVVVDRQGGRMHYRESLQAYWPESFITILAESERISRYRLDFGGRSLTVSFEVDSEQSHLPVALASMTAKYVRELLMARLNRFFLERLPGLKPTAGYVADGRRYLRDIRPVVETLRIERELLVRKA